MNAIKFLFLFVLGLLFISACLPQPAELPPVTPTLPPQDGQGGIEPPAAVIRTAEEFARLAGIRTEQVEIVLVEEKEWPDACLGAAGADEMCASVITPGWRIILRGGLKMVEYHTDRDGSVIRQAEGNNSLIGQAQTLVAGLTGQDAADVEVTGFAVREWPDGCLGAGRPEESCLAALTPGFLVQAKSAETTFEVRVDQALAYGRVTASPEAVVMARVVETIRLAEETKAADVRITSVMPVEWPDSCLGVNEPGVMCMMVITPGYRVSAQVDGKLVVFHTNENGSRVVRGSFK